jgi:hypothetical protein
MLAQKNSPISVDYNKRILHSPKFENQGFKTTQDQISPRFQMMNNIIRFKQKQMFFKALSTQKIIKWQTYKLAGTIYGIQP